MILRAASLAVLALLLAGAAPPQRSPEVEKLLREASRWIEMADAGAGSNAIASIASWQEALKRLRKAEKLAPDDPEIRFWRPEIELYLAQAWIDDSKPGFAFDVLEEMVAPMRANGFEGLDATQRNQLARGLRLYVETGFRSDHVVEARKALADLVVLSRQLRASEPANQYLTRKFAEDLADEAFIRFITADAEGTRAAAAEMVEITAALAEAEPNDADAQTNHFMWLFRNAEFNDDPDLYRVAVENGDALATRGLLKDPYKDYLAIARERVAEAERRGF